jgi:hypothetical protein
MGAESEKDSGGAPSRPSKNELDEDVLGFLALLIEVDKRVNPHLYEKENGV